MSSLAASRADGYYFPPEWRPEMGGISKFQGSKGANQWEKYGVIRFELPFDGFCLKCDRHMGKGLRFNAKKEKAGKYFSTQIFSFEMKCYSCDQRFKILTDPANRTYDYAEGIRKQEQDYTVRPEEDQVIDIGSDSERIEREKDPMKKLQYDEENKLKVVTANRRIAELTEQQEARHGDFFDNNSMLRQLNRKRRRRDEKMVSDGKARGLSMPLLEANEDDAIKARNVNFRQQQVHMARLKEREEMTAIRQQSIFDSKIVDRRSNINNNGRSSSSSGTMSREALVVRSSKSTSRKAVLRTVQKNLQKIQQQRETIESSVTSHNDADTAEVSPVESNTSKDALNMLAHYSDSD